MSRDFKEMIFLGNGKVSEGRVRALHSKLDFAVIMLGYLQQPPHSSCECEAQRAEEDNRKGQAALEEAVRDIAAALTGREIEFKP